MRSSDGSWLPPTIETCRIDTPAGNLEREMYVTHNETIIRWCWRPDEPLAHGDIRMGWAYSHMQQEWVWGVWWVLRGTVSHAAQWDGKQDAESNLPPEVIATVRLLGG